MRLYRKCEANGALVSRSIAGETLLIPVRAQVADLAGMYVLKAVGPMVWDRLGGRTTLAALVDAVCQDYDVSSDVAATDVAAFLAALATAGLIVSVTQDEEIRDADLRRV